MTDLKDRFSALLSAEPDAPDDVDWIVTRGRRAWRRRRAVSTVAGGAGAAALTAAVIVPIVLVDGGGGPSAVSIATHKTSPTAVPTPTPHCMYRVTNGPHGQRQASRMRANAKALRADAKRLGVTSSGQGFTTREVRHGASIYLAYCAKGDAAPTEATPSASPSPTTPPYSYTESPQAISDRLGAYLTGQVTALGLTSGYTRPFSQETSTLESGHPDYFGGNVDIHESSGYGDIGVQVNHQSTEQQALTGPCDPDSRSQCQQSTLPDGSILHTDRVYAGTHNLILTAEVSRPDGVLVQAQESNYPFGPDAATEPDGSEPLTMDQLIGLAEDPHFTF
jgi:hypothetical protein